MSSTSDNDRPEARAVRELDTLVRHLADELAGFRRRALTAEARLRDIGAHDSGAVNADLANRVAELEQDNQRLQERLNTATSRTKAILDRVRFLRQQAQAGGGDR
jgi:hypothetical protein